MRMMIVAALALCACGRTPADSADESAAPAAAVSSSTGWDAHLFEMLPFIDACLAKSPETRTVTFAGATGEALISVRLTGASQRVDCTVPEGDPTATSAVVGPRREDWQAPSEGDAIFVRGPGENPGGECYEAPEVRSESGELLGWWLDPEGC